MKFLVLAQYFPPEVGASQVRLASLCKELKRAGHSVEVVTAMPHHPQGSIFPEYRGAFYRRETRDGLTIHRVWLYASSESALKRILSYVSFCLTCLFALFRSDRPDYVYVDSPPLFLGVPGWIAARLWRTRFLFNVADLWPDSVRELSVMRSPFLFNMARRLEAWIYFHADYVTAVTEGIRETLLHVKHVPAAKVLFLPNGVDTQLFHPRTSNAALKRELGLESKQVILYAGNHGYAGGVEQLLQAADDLRDNTKIHFLLIGDGPEKSRLRQMAARLGLVNVTFLDPVPLEKLPAFTSISDAAVVTLRKSPITEGARPAKMLVMMGAGKPIILAAKGEAASLLESAEAGIVVPPEEHLALAAAIRSLLNDPVAMRQFGANGRNFVITHLEWSSLVRNWLDQLSGSFSSGTPLPEEVYTTEQKFSRTL